MRVSASWLADFVDLPSIEEVSEHLLRAGIEVEEIHDPRDAMNDVVVGEIVECGPHPKADRLNLCRVTDGSTTHSVVCGASNVATGLRVAFARVGGRVGDLQIEAREIRGAQSAGMICARDELGLTSAKCEGIWELSEDWNLGSDIVEAANLLPTMVLGVTPNRPDCLSHLGVAREIAAATGQRLRIGNWHLSEKGAGVEGRVRISVDSPEGCPRYVARVVDNVNVGPSPGWLVDRLESVGQRSVNNVVDVTNYVLLELGQPLHAFDLQTIASTNGAPTVHIRDAKEGETMTTLDGEEHTLHAEDLLIADAERVLALAGVMGGLDSEVTDATETVLIEAAHFHATRVRRSAKRHGMHTEASHRFERGTDPVLPLRAAERCAQLLASEAGGVVAKGVVEVAQRNDEGSMVDLRLSRIPRLLGVALLAEEVVPLLEPLEIRCASRTPEQLRFEIPTFRPDIVAEVDLIEEVARRYGVDKLPERLPDASGAYEDAVAEPQFATIARKALLGAGCDEAVTYGFGSPTAHKDAIRLRNPLGEELSAMRTSLLPGLFGVAAHNQRHGRKALRIFEIGQTFHPRSSTADEDERDQNLPTETPRVGVVMFGGRHEGAWYESAEQIDFSDLAGTLETLMEGFRLPAGFRFEAANLEGWNPFCGAVVKAGDTIVGLGGHVHPQRLKEFGVEGTVFAAEIDLEKLGELQGGIGSFQKLPRYPGTRRDLALECDEGVAAGDIQQFLRENAGGGLGKASVESVELFDVYRGRGVAKGRVSLAFALHYRLAERTLTDDEVTEAFEAVRAKVSEAFDAALR